jgi:biopolymer transport protein ExbD
MFQELDKRLKMTEFDQVNSILKNLSKMLSLFSDYKEKGIEIYTEQDAQTFYNKLIEVIAAIKKDKETRLK